jgi:CHAD domain-containing protein
MLAQEPGTRLGEDIEALHQMRVATRRMRAGLDMFADVLPVRAVRLRAELGWLAAVLGEVRDLDIQLGRFDDWTEEMPGDHRQALDELADLLAGHHREARRALLEALDSRRYERLVAGLVTMLEQGPSRRAGAGRAPAVTAMPALIADRHRAAGKAARRAKRTGVPADYHRLRIRCKRLRYSLEFAGGLYEGELKGFARQMTRLQDVLGSMQDAEVASGRLRELAMTEEGASLSRATIFAMGGVAERYRSEAERLLEELPGLVRLLKGKEWRRARSLMDSRREQAIELLGGASSSLGARAQPIQVVGRARPALPHLGSLGVAAAGSTPDVPPAGAGSEPSEALTEELEQEADPVLEDAPTTITPIRRQVAPS